MKEEICLNTSACSKTHRSESSSEFPFLGIVNPGRVLVFFRNGTRRNWDPDTPNLEFIFSFLNVSFIWSFTLLSLEPCRTQITCDSNSNINIRRRFQE